MPKITEDITGLFSNEDDDMFLVSSAERLGRVRIEICNTDALYSRLVKYFHKDGIMSKIEVYKVDPSQLPVVEKIGPAELQKIYGVLQTKLKHPLRS